MKRYEVFSMRRKAQKAKEMFLVVHFKVTKVGLGKPYSTLHIGARIFVL